MVKDIKQYIGKKLLSIIDLDTTKDIIKTELQRITDNNYSGIDNAKMLLFEGNEALIFVDFDSDGYRSGNWHLINVENVLDGGATKGIKIINSNVINIEFLNIASKDYCLITTDEYLISMGQDGTDDYYPRNFFDIEECKNYALGKMELIK